MKIYFCHMNLAFSKHFREVLPLFSVQFLRPTMLMTQTVYMRAATTRSQMPLMPMLISDLVRLNESCNNQITDAIDAYAHF